MWQRLTTLRCCPFQQEGGREGGRVRGWEKLKLYLVDLIKSIQEEPFCFLAKTADPSVINKALLYVRDNEQTSRVWIVHFSKRRGGAEQGEEEGGREDDGEKEAFEAAVKVIDKIYPKIMVSRERGREGDKGVKEREVGCIFC